MKRVAFKQGALTGLCGPYGVANALFLLNPGRLSVAEASALARRLAAALPCGFDLILREGTDRAQMELMLRAAARWSAERAWPAWRYEAMHPTPGAGARRFWNDLAPRLAPRRVAALVGFGEHSGGNGRYEPHWTCVERVGARTIYLRDSDEYQRVPRSATAIKPEAGWEIEDCFLLSRVGAVDAQLEYDRAA
jgi:hypothetical protein